MVPILKFVAVKFEAFILFADSNSEIHFVHLMFYNNINHSYINSKYYFITACPNFLKPFVNTFTFGAFVFPS